MNFLVGVSYSKRIEIAVGTSIQIRGIFDKIDHVIASSITDSARGIVFGLHPDEIPESTHYPGPVPWTVPLIAQVVSCYQWGEYTHLDVYPTGQTLYDFHRVSLLTARTAVPAFWKLADDSRKWENSFVPKGMSIWNAKQQRPQVFKAGFMVAALRRYAKFHPTLKLQFCEQSIWQSAEKLLHAERHLERLKVIDDVRRHLYVSSMSEGREFILAETREEAGITVEAAITSLYSALDILGHAINEFYNIGLATNSVGFISAVADKAPRANDEEPQNRRSLQTLFPNDPLTKYLLSQREEWIMELEEWRHNIIHHGCLRTGEFREGGVLVFLQRELDFLSGSVNSQRDAKTLVDDWVTHFKELFAETLKLMETRAIEASVVFEAKQPASEEAKPLAPPDRTKALDVLRSFLELWVSDTERQPRKYSKMYAALMEAWRKEWPFKMFQKFIGSHHLQEFQSVGGVYSGTNARYGQLYRVVMTLKFEEANAVWGFNIIPENKSRMALHLLPFSVPPSFTKRMSLADVRRWQSGKETGYRDVIVSGVVHNTSEVAVTDIEAHVFCKDMSEAFTLIGTLASGEQRRFQVSWKNACVPFHPDFPPISTDLLWGGSVRVRFTYRLETDEGDLWAEDIALT